MSLYETILIQPTQHKGQALVELPTGFKFVGTVLEPNGLMFVAVKPIPSYYHNPGCDCEDR